MNTAVFDMHRYERPFFEELNVRFDLALTYFPTRLSEETVRLAEDFEAVCCFTNDRLNEPVLKRLQAKGTKLIALRSAGFNHVDLLAAKTLGLKVVRVPAYSPYAVAEYVVTLIMALNRQICRASTRVHDLNFALDGLVGFDLHGKTVGIIGTGKIGRVLAKILLGFGCKVIAFDQNPDAELADRLDLRYVPIAELYKTADIVSLHVPLTIETKHIVDSRALASMKKGVMLINTGRGALIDTPALITALKAGQVGAAGLDVYEEEESIFSRDLSGTILQDDTLARLMTFPNVLITAHQAFLTREALHDIAEATLQNLTDYKRGSPLINEIKNI